MKKIQVFSLSVRGIWVFFILLSANVFATDAVQKGSQKSEPQSVSNSDPSSKYILCKFSKAVRTVRVIEDNSGCRTSYTKGGVDKIVGASKSLEVCLGILKSIRENLVLGNWSCKDISESDVSESSDSKQ